MSTGLAIYGVEQTHPVAALEWARRFFAALGASVTCAVCHKRITSAQGEGIEPVEVELDVLRQALVSGEAAEFRLYSEAGQGKPAGCCVGYTTEHFGNFFCIDAQLEAALEHLEDGFINVVDQALPGLSFSYAIVYQAGRVEDALWYARGENLKILYPFEHPVAFAQDTPGLYDGQRSYEKTRLRMVYPVNYLNEHHLRIAIDGVPLPEWIAMDPERGALKTLAGMTRWMVPERALAEVNKTLGQSGALVAWRPVQHKTRKLP